MKLTITLSGAPQARTQIDSLLNRLRDMSPAAKRAGLVVLVDGKERIRADGPGWLPTYETQKGSPLQRTGRLIQSLDVGASGNVDVEIPGGVRVGTNLRTDDGKWAIGELMQFGTGIYAGHGMITAKSGGRLAFTINGKFYRPKAVKGSPKRPIFVIDERLGSRVLNVYRDWIATGELGAQPSG